jgi:hypothetical protein
MLRFLLALALLLCPAAPLPVLAQETHYLKIPNQDAAMEEAKAKARATLSHFWERLGSPGAGESGFALKVALPYGDNNTEHIWTKNVERKDWQGLRRHQQRATGCANGSPRRSHRDRRAPDLGLDVRQERQMGRQLHAAAAPEAHAAPPSRTLYLQARRPLRPCYRQLFFQAGRAEGEAYGGRGRP